MNQYEIFQTDIAPLGFHLATMDGYLTREAIQEIQATLESPLRRQQMAIENYTIARQHFSYENLRRSLALLIEERQPTEMDHQPRGQVSNTPDAKVFYLYGNAHRGRKRAMAPQRASR